MAIDLIARVAAHAVEEGQSPLPLVATEGEVLDAEKQLGFPLHPLLRRLYLEVANGGFGPEYFLMPLSGATDSVTAEYAGFAALDEENEQCGQRDWPLGVVPILTWGCGMYAAVDCTSPDGMVLLYEPNGGHEDRTLAWFFDSKSLADWLEVWIDGAGWYSEDNDGDADPVPWEDAADRLRLP